MSLCDVFDFSWNSNDCFWGNEQHDYGTSLRSVRARVTRTPAARHPPVIAIGFAKGEGIGIRTFRALKNSMAVWQAACG